jgi:hypothetical protein
MIILLCLVAISAAIPMNPELYATEFGKKIPNSFVGGETLNGLLTARTLPIPSSFRSTNPLLPRYSPILLSQNAHFGSRNPNQANFASPINAFAKLPKAARKAPTILPKPGYYKLKTNQDRAPSANPRFIYGNNRAFASQLQGGSTIAKSLGTFKIHPDDMQDDVAHVRNLFGTNDIDHIQAIDDDLTKSKLERLDDPVNLAALLAQLIVNPSSKNSAELAELSHKLDAISGKANKPTSLTEKPSRYDLKGAGERSTKVEEAFVKKLRNPMKKSVDSGKAHDTGLIDRHAELGSTNFDDEPLPWR